MIYRDDKGVNHEVTVQSIDDAYAYVTFPDGSSLRVRKAALVEPLLPKKRKGLRFVPNPDPTPSPPGDPCRHDYEAEDDKGWRCRKCGHQT